MDPSWRTRRAITPSSPQADRLPLVVGADFHRPLLCCQRWCLRGRATPDSELLRAADKDAHRLLLRHRSGLVAPEIVQTQISVTSASLVLTTEVCTTIIGTCTVSGFSSQIVAHENRMGPVTFPQAQRPDAIALTEELSFVVGGRSLFSSLLFNGGPMWCLSSAVPRPSPPQVLPSSSRHGLSQGNRSVPCRGLLLRHPSYLCPCVRRTR